MLKLSSRLSRRGRAVRGLILGICLAPLGGTYFYNHGHKLGFLVCPIKHLTGIPCPTCGMTRSFMAIGRGDLHQAMVEHLFGPVLFAIFVIAAIHTAVELAKGRQIQAFYGRWLGSRGFRVAGFALYLGYYLLRLSYWFSSEELRAAFFPFSLT